MMSKVLGLADRDVDLLTRCADVEPCECFTLEMGYGPWCEAEGLGVEFVGEVEGRCGNHEVDVVDACYHVGQSCKVNKPGEYSGRWLGDVRTWRCMMG